MSAHQYSRQFEIVTFQMSLVALSLHIVIELHLFDFNLNGNYPGSVVAFSSFAFPVAHEAWILCEPIPCDMMRKTMCIIFKMRRHSKENHHRVVYSIQSMVVVGRLTQCLSCIQQMIFHTLVII